MHTDDEGKPANNSEISRKKGGDIYISAAHTIARCIDLSCDVRRVFETMRLLHQEELSQIGELDEDDNARVARRMALQRIPDKEQAHATKVYHHILQILPSLQPIIDDIGQVEELNKICNKINANIKSTRSNDANHLKPCIGRYCAPNAYDPASLNPPVRVMNGRSELGLNHPVLARWICPADKLADFDANPEQTRNDLASGVIPIEAGDFPAVFWGGRLPGDDIDPSDFWHGIFRSYLLIRASFKVARHIFLGPSFAIESTGKKKRACNAILNNVTSIEAEHIAYVCVQTRFAISSKDTWNEVDGRLNYFDMYHLIIELINEDSEPEWKDDLLKWWNKEIFGNERGQGGTTSMIGSDSDSMPRLSMMGRLRAQKKENIEPVARPTPPVLDPAFIAAESATSANLAAPAAPPTLATPSASSALNVSTHGPSASTTSGSASMNQQASRSSKTTITREISPLSDSEPEIPVPLSPLPMNQPQQPSEKAKGKKRAANREENGATGERVKRPRRCRK